MKRANGTLRTISGIVCLTMLVGLCLSGCGAGTKTPNEPGPSTSQSGAAPAGEQAGAPDYMKGTLRLVGPGGFDNLEDTADPVTKNVIPGYKKIIELFKEKYPEVTLEIEGIPWDSWTAKLQTTAAGGLADVLVHGATVVDVVEDLTPYFDGDPEFADSLIVPTSPRRSDPDDYTKIIPTGVVVALNPVFINYDKQLFDDFGVPYPSDKYTWDDLLEMSKKLTGKNPKTGKDCYGIYISGAVIDTWKPFMSYNFAKEIKTVEFAKSKFDTKVSYDNPEVIGAFTYFNNLSKHCPKGFVEGKGMENFGTEENNVAMILTGSPLYYNKSVASGTEDRMGYAPYPVREKAEGYSAYTGDWNMAIPKTSKNKKAAWEFIKWMATDEAVAEWLIASAKVPNSKKGMEKLQSMGIPYAKTTSLQFEKYPKNFMYATSEYYDNMFGPIDSVFGNNIIAMYSGHATPEQCAKAIQKEIDEYISNNK